MEQNQPIKKRLLEQQTYISTYDGSQKQCLVPQIQYIQYIPAGVCDFKNQQLGPQSQIIRLANYDAPMMLNAWTQTNCDDFPPLNFKTFNENVLLAKIQELEEKLKAQSEIINKINRNSNLTSQPIVAIPSDRVPIEYRILKQMNGPNNETQIEIQIKDDIPEEENPSDNSDEFKEDQKENDIVEQMYAQISKSSESNMKNQKAKDEKGPLVSIGPNDTKVPAAEFEKLSWSSASIATRKLLSFLFDRETLATHSMTGKASPAFKDRDKPVKRKLDSNAIEDIIFAVTKKCGVSPKEVRAAITTKCADENKMLKLKALKSIDSKKRSVLSDINHTKFKRK